MTNDGGSAGRPNKPPSDPHRVELRPKSAAALGERPYAFSMAKRRTAGTQTAQLGFVEVFDFSGICWLALYHVSAVFALITQKRNTKSGARRRKGPAHGDLSSNATYEEPLKHSHQIVTVELISRENLRWFSYHSMSNASCLFPRRLMTIEDHGITAVIDLDVRLGHSKHSQSHALCLLSHLR